MLALGEAARAAAIAKEARGLARDDGLIAIRAALVGFEAGDDALIEDAMPAIPDGPDADLLRFRLAARRGDWPGLVALEGREVPETERRMVDTASALARVRMSAPAVDLEALRRRRRRRGRSARLRAGRRGGGRPRPGRAVRPRLR